MQQTSYGIYYLANDNVLDWLTASLASVRAQGCRAPIAIIPFDDEMKRVARLQRKFDFEIWYPAELEQLDEIGAWFNQEEIPRRQCRKFAAFWGPFEHFTYADADTIALVNYDSLMDGFLAAGLDFMYYDGDPNHVFKPGAFRDSLLRERLRITFNAGFFSAVKGILDASKLAALAQQALVVKENFVENAGDQPLLNYCMAIQLPRIAQAHEVMPNLYGFMWAGSVYQGRTDMFDEMYRTGQFQGKQFPFIHWAGFRVSPAMAHSKLFLHYRLLHAPLLDRMKFSAQWTWRAARAARTQIYK